MTDIRGVYNIILGYVTEETIDNKQVLVLDLPANALSSPPIESLYAEFMNGGPLRLILAAEPVLNLGQNIVTVSDATGLSFPLAGTNVDVVWTILNDVAEMEITAALPYAPGSLVLAFPKLKGTQADTLLFSDTTVLTLASYDVAPSLPRGLALNGALMLYGQLASIRVLFNSDRVPLAGPMTITADIPVFQLLGEITGEVVVGSFGTLSMTFLLADEAVDNGGGTFTPKLTIEVLSAIKYTSAGQKQSLTIHTGGFAPEDILFQGDLSEALELGLAAVSQLADSANVQGLLPAELPIPPMVEFGTWTMTLDVTTARLRTLSAGLALNTSWEIIPDVISLERVEFEFFYSALAVDPFSMTATALTAIGEGDEPGIVRITAYYPGFRFDGGLVPGTKINLYTLALRFIGQGAADIIPQSLAVTELSFSVDPANVNFAIAAGISIGWDLTVGPVTIILDLVRMAISRTAGKISGLISAEFKVVTTSPFRLALTAGYDGAGAGWYFKSALTEGTIPLGSLIQEYAPVFSDFPLDGLVVTALEARFESGTNQSYGFTVAVEWQISPQILALEAALELESRTTGGTTKYVGEVGGAITFFGVRMGAKTSLGVVPPTYTFEFWGATATLANNILRFTLPDRSLGEIITLLVDAALPGEGITLPPPFNVLNAIRLSNFGFEFNFNTNISKITYPVTPNLGLDFGFMAINQFALTYDGNTRIVELSISAGRFLDRVITPTTPQNFNVTDPASMANTVPGQGTKLFDLRFLALGQHVSPKTPLPLGTTISYAVSSLEASFLPTRPLPPPPPPPAPPYTPISKTELKFDDGANWIVALDAVILETVTIKALFLDPEMYGISISVLGPKGGNFNGLSFDILYRRVNENVGVYQIELKLPDIMRTLEFGAVTLTLPIIKVEVFTNGDFRVDLGFPTNGDFSRSFGLQILPFIGSGGFYFGVMSSASSTRVPATPYGEFSPVLELGIGLSVGLGKEINKGILAAGLSVTLQGIVEGVIAWYSPYDGNPAKDNAFFYAIRGKFALVGNIFGEINFAIISARFDITVRVGVTLFVEIYQPVQFGFFASVRVSLTVKINLGIFKISISLSFEAKIEENFTVGSRSTAPWDSALAAPRTRARLAGATPLDDDQCPEIVTPSLVWQPILLDGAPRTQVELISVGQLTAASPIVNNLAGDAKAKAVASLVSRTTTKEGELLAPFVELAQGIFLWGLASYLFREQSGVTKQQILDATVTAEELEATYCQMLVLPPGNVEPFTQAELDAFVSGYFHFRVTPAEASEEERLVSSVPMVPAITMTTPAGDTVDFSLYNETSTEVLAAIKEYFRELQMAADKASNAPALARSLASAETALSMATFLWMDFFAMIARESIQSAIDALASAVIETDGSASLRQLAARHGRYGRTAEELARANMTRPLQGGGTLHRRARQAGADPLAYALANLDTTNLFAPGKLLVPDAQATTVAELLPLIGWDDLSGLAARVLLAGLRPPYPAGDGTTSELMALYDISGQQFDAAGLTAGSTITLTAAASDWLTIDGPVVFTQTEADIAAAFNGIVLDPAYAEPPEPQPLYRIQPKRFSLANPVDWTTEASSIWIFPDDLQTLITGEHALRPKVTIVEEVQDSARRAPAIAAQGDEIPHVWATVIPVVVRQIPSAADASVPLPTTYDFRGTTQEGGVLLQALLSWWETNGNPDFISSIQLLHPPDPAQENPPDGVVSPEDEVEYFLVQTNLSTVSNPLPAARSRSRLRLTADAEAPVGMTPIEVLKLVWECSIVRSGGYDLSYTAAGVGLPGYLFEQESDVTLTMAVTYAISDDVLESFLNAVILQQPANPDANTYIEAVPQTVPATMIPRAATLHDLGRRHHATAAEIAHLNRKKALRPGAKLFTRTGEGACAPQESEASSGLSTQDSGLTSAPGTSHSALTTVTGLQTLDSLARTHRTTVAALAVANRHVPQLFADTPSVEDQLVERIVQIPPGNTAWQMVRTAPVAPQLTLGAPIDDQTPQQAIAELYNLAGFTILDNPTFRATDWALPASPAQDDVPPSDLNADRAARFQADVDAGLWPYRAALPIARFAKEPAAAPPGTTGGPDPALSPYRGVGGSVLLDIEFLDTFGNRVKTGNGSPNTLPIDVWYFDDLVPLEEWAGSGFDYTITGDGTAAATLTIDINFDTSPYLAPVEGGPNPVEMAASVSRAYALAWYQLAQSNVETALNATSDTRVETDTAGTKTELLRYLGQCYDFLIAVAAGTTPVTPVPAVLSRSVACDNSSDLFEMVVTLTITRTGDIDPNLDDPIFAAVRTVSSVVQPNYTPQPTGGDVSLDEPLTLRDFAEKLETAFPGEKVLVGTPETGSDGAPRPRETWLMRLPDVAGSDGISYSIAKGTPRFYAIAPVSRAPQSKDAPIYEYVTGSYIADSVPLTQSFSTVDLEVQAQELLAAVDQFLLPDYVVPAWEILNTPTTVRPNAVDEILAAKQLLAGKIAATLAPVLAKDVNGPAEALAQAAESVRQQLLIRLSDAYSIDTVIQFDVTVTSDFAGPKSPALYGKPLLLTAGAADEKNYSLTTTRFSLANDATPYLTFSFSTRSDREAAVVQLPLRLTLSNVEQPGDLVDGIPDYRPSSWLTFAIPPAADDPRNDLGTPSIPVPLRAYPTPPAMAAQSGVPKSGTTDVAGNLDEAKQWLYSFAYDYPPADQDTVYATVEFTSPQAPLAKSSERLDLFTALVQFNTQYRKILVDLNETLLGSGGDPVIATNAIRSLAWLVGRAAEAWDNRTDSTAAMLGTGNVTTSVRSIRVKESATQYEGTDGVLLLTITSLEGETPTPSIPGFQAVPVVVTEGSGWVFTALDGSGRPLLRAEALTLPRRALTYANLTVLIEESANAGTHVRRNEAFGIERANDVFIYQTPEIRFFTPLTPELEPDIVIDVADYTTPPAPLATYLKNFLIELFKGAPATSLHTLRVAGRFTYALQPMEGFPIALPIFLTGPVTVQSTADLNALGDRLAEFITTWFAERGITGKSGQLWFEVSLYSGATMAQLPTLKLSKVFLDTGAF
jgi:hypothetical protein